MEKVMKNFSLEDEEIIRSFIFTNPHGEAGFLYPQELIAGEEMSPLMSAVSRTHKSLQERVLSFLDTDKTEQVAAVLPLIRPLMNIFRKEDGTLNVSPKSAYFNKEWTLAHGHSTIKEETQLYGYSENHSDITGKHLSGHPLSRPQVKSTRYITYNNVLGLSLNDADLLNLNNSAKVLEFVNYMNNRYVEATEQLAQKVYSHPDTLEIRKFLSRQDIVDAEVAKVVERKKYIDSEFVPDDKFINAERAKYLSGLTDPEKVLKDLEKFAIDYTRTYLIAATKTSAVFSMDARTLEEVITGMISNPRIEDQKRGYELWAEVKKVAPILLGEKGHIGVDPWKMATDKEMRDYAERKFGHIKPSRLGESRHTAKVFTPQDIEMYTDRFNAALIIFQYSDLAIEDIIPKLDQKTVKEVLSKAHEYRENHDIIHPGISHGGMIVEILMGYHGYRDVFRHRRGSRTNQLLTTRHGFENPEIFKIFNMENQYKNDMHYASNIFEIVRKENPHVAEKVVPFGSLVQAIHSWQMNQIGYVANLRGKFSTGNLSYVYMVRDMVEQVREKMPLTGQYFKYDTKDYPVHLWKKGLNWYDLTQK